MNNNFIRNNVPDFMTVSQDDVAQALKKCVDSEDFHSLIGEVIQKKMKHLIKEISKIEKYISINGNFNNTPRGINCDWLESYYRHFLTDREFIERYFPSYLEDDLEHDYEVYFCGSLCITTNDLGTITFDWFDDDSGEVNCEIQEHTPDSRLLYDWLSDKTKCKWHINNTTLIIDEVN